MNTTEISPALMERVDAGLEWANENIQDWEEFVNPKTFDIMSGDRCFLGQYWIGKHKEYYGDDTAYLVARAALLNDSQDRAAELGFTRGWTASHTSTWTELNEAWQQKFRELGML